MTSPLPPTPTNVDAGESLVKLAATLPPSKQFPWYQVSFGSRLTPECRQLFEEYSRIAPEEVERHVYAMVCMASMVRWMSLLSLVWDTGHTLTEMTIRKERGSMGDLSLPMYWRVLVSHSRSIQPPSLRLAPRSPPKRRRRSPGASHRHWDVRWPGSAQTRARWRDARPADGRGRFRRLREDWPGFVPRH